MRNHCSDVCKLRPCLNKESKNSARLRTIVTAALQRQYSQTELIFWISLVHIGYISHFFVAYDNDERVDIASCIKCEENCVYWCLKFL